MNTWMFMSPSPSNYQLVVPDTGIVSRSLKLGVWESLVQHYRLVLTRGVVEGG